jgi:hypothetical protein
MMYPSEYGPILKVDPNYDWARVEDMPQEDRVVSKAAMCLLMGGVLDIYETDRTLPPVRPGVEEPDDEIGVPLTRFETSSYPIGEDRYVEFDQLYLVDDDEGDAIWQGNEGVFAMFVTNAEGAHEGQYMFKIDNAFWPISGTVYAGYDGISEEARVRAPKHLSALERFLDKLQVVIIRYEAEIMVRYPQIDTEKPKVVDDVS